MKKSTATLLLVMLFAVYILPTFAQREYAVCDSTFYPLNTDTTIIAGRNKLYLNTNNTTTLLYDFSTADVDEYIRDFDIVTPNLWYTVVGLRYIGGPTQLYKSTNKGQSWALDTNHYSAANADMVSPQFLASINNMQHLNGDTLMMFMHYYSSGILYSTNLGQTWTKWFDNLIVHYQGMFECQDKYYIFGYEGDAFRAYMFGFDKNLLFSSDSAGMWSSFNNNSYHPACYQGNDSDCIYASSSLGRCETYTYFKNKIDTICALSALENIEITNVKIYPSPFTNKLTIDGATGNEYYTLSNVYGQKVWEGKHIEQHDFYYLPGGMYLLSLTKSALQKTVKLIKE